jgi:GAF domain-containing protein
LDTAPGMLRDTMRRRHQALSLFRRSAASDPPSDRIIGEALGLARTFLRADRYAHASRASGEAPFALTAGRGWDGGIVGRECLRGDPGSLGAYAHELGRPLVVEDLRFAPQFHPEPVLVGAGTRGLLLAPIRGQRGASGLLGVFSSTRRLFSPDEAEFLCGLADVISAALYREDWRHYLASQHPHGRSEVAETNPHTPSRQRYRRGPGRPGQGPR